jgi:DNA-binding TFAR19-related protein (PDSD5 family)
MSRRRLLIAPARLSKSAWMAYVASMNQLLDKALKAVERLPEDEQNEIAQLMLDLAEKGAVVESIDPAHLSDVLKGLQQAQQGEFASAAEVEAAFKRFES